MNNLASLLKTDGIHLAVLLFLCASIILIPYAAHGFPTGPDMVQHFRFALVYREALANGDFFPGWTLDNLGLGNLGVRFYPPLVYYVAAAFHLLTGQWNTALLATFVGWLFLGGAGVYLFVRQWTTPSWALFAAALYAWMPYHLNQIFQQFLYGEFAAAGILPFCFLFLTKSLRSRKWADAAVFSFFFALLILTHLPSTITGTISLAIYGACLIDRRHFAKQFLQTSAALILSFALTSFYWIKVVAERAWLAHNDERFHAGYFGFAQWLFPLTIIPRVLYQSVIASFLMDTMILMTAAILFPALIFLWVNRRAAKDFEYRAVAGLAITALAGFFMLSRPSYYLWEFLPVLQRIQFPFRWLTVLSFLAVVAGILSLSQLMSRFRHRTRAAAYAVVALLVVMMLFNVSQIIMTSTTMSGKQLDATIAGLAETPSLSAWWTVWADERAFQAPGGVSAPGSEIVFETWSAETREFTVFGEQPATLRIATFYYPYWKATVNGVAVEISKAEYGLMALDVPAGEARVRLALCRPAAEQIARFISLIGWLLLIIWSIVYRFKARPDAI